MAPERLRVLREAHDLSLRDLATIVDVTPQYLSMVETGKKRLSLNLQQKLSRYYRVEPEVLVRPCKGPPPPDEPPA